MYQLETERRSNLSLLPGIVDQPGRTMAQLLAYPRLRWALPALLCVLSLIVLLAVSAPYMAQEAQNQQALALQRIQPQLEDMTQSQRQQMEQMMTRFSSPGVVLGIALATGLLGIAMAWMVGAGILYFALAVSGRDLRVGQVFGAFSWTWPPFALRDLVSAGWVYFTQQLIVNPGLSYFLSSGDTLADAQDPRWIVAGYFDLFVLWHVVLVYFLVRATARRGGGVALTILYALVSLVLRVAPRLLAATVGPSLGP